MNFRLQTKERFSAFAASRSAFTSSAVAKSRYCVDRYPAAFAQRRGNDHRAETESTVSADQCFPSRQVLDLRPNPSQANEIRRESAGVLRDVTLRICIVNSQNELTAVFSRE